MLPNPFHGYKPNGADRVALVVWEPTTDRQQVMIRTLRGPSKTQLRSHALLGPFAEEEVKSHFQAAIADLREEGYYPAGVPDLLEGLQNPDAGVRARSALRLGWRRYTEAVPLLLEKLPAAVDESCSFLDALGMMGDSRAIPLLRDYAARKLLSRRRSALEALRLLDDREGISTGEQLALQRLPETIRAILENSAPHTLDNKNQEIAQAFTSLAPAEQGLTLETLYELASPVSVSAARVLLLQVDFPQPYLWRAIKSIYKRAMLRGDAATFGLLSHAFEVRGRSSKRKVVTVKSGYDGQSRMTTLFGRTTWFYLRGLGWRFLRDLAQYRPEQYARHAAEVLIHFLPEEIQKWGTERCYIFHRILFGSSTRYRYDARKMRFQLKPSTNLLGFKTSQKPGGSREEEYPHLWDEFPRAYLRLLEAGKLPMVQAFAVEAIKNRHPRLLREASPAQILAMLEAPHEETVELALTELDRRFDLENPDWKLLLQMLQDDRSLARTIGQRWLRLTAHMWLKDVDRIIDFLGINQPNLRALVVELTVGALFHDPSIKPTLAKRFYLIFSTPELLPGSQDGMAVVTREALREEMASLASVSELVEWLARGSQAVQIMVGEVLCQRTDAIDTLGMAGLISLANHDLVAVRKASQVLIRSNLPRWRNDPSLLLTLVESPWEDTRSFAMDIFRDQMEIPSLGFEGILGLLDSNRLEVQNLGKDLARRNLDHLPAGELVNCLAEHPHPNLKEFALELATQYLPNTGESLGKMSQFCRSALLDPWPQRSIKQRIIAFLLARGLEDPQQAQIACTLLGDLVRSRTQRDFEQALQALVRLKIAYPELESTVQLVSGDALP